MKRRDFLTLSAVAVALPAGATAGERDAFDRPSIGEPLRFRNADGGAFRPSELILVTDKGTFGAPLPRTAEVSNEDRVDLSGLPLVGPVFKETLSPDDAREGMLVGPVERIGDMLVVRATGFPEGLARAPVVVSTSVPRLGPVSYAVGNLEYRDVVIPAVVGETLGSAHLVGGRLVIASRGGEAAYPSVQDLVDDLFN